MKRQKNYNKEMGMHKIAKEIISNGVNAQSSFTFLNIEGL
jgi:hypothetical protein